ncbi:MAG: amidohydrolase family protein [Chloroflexi bacterium]|nr:amidohydrolase family protein [Chloroflexota bacterium]
MIIDFHTHLLPPSFDKRRKEIAAKDRTFAALFTDPQAKMASKDDLLSAMAEDGVDMAVALGYGWTDPGVARESNDYLLEAAAASNGRIIAFCSVDPSWGDPALREVERCVAAGARGIGELHPSTQKTKLATDRGLAGVMALAAKEGLPVVVHGSEPLGHEYPGKGDTHPGQLLAMATRFPDVKIIAGHWGGGLPFYAHMPEVREVLANVYFDSAATPFLYDQGVFSTVASAVGPDHMLFGSDFPLLRPKRVAEMAIADLRPAHAAMFLGGNARALLTA